MQENTQEIKLNPESFTAEVGKEVIKLSATEYRILAILLKHRGQPVSRMALYAAFPDKKNRSFTNIVDVYINYLRGKIGKERIRTVRGVGYTLQEVAA